MYDSGNEYVWVNHINMLCTLSNECIQHLGEYVIMYVKVVKYCSS